MDGVRAFGGDIGDTGFGRIAGIEEVCIFVVETFLIYPYIIDIHGSLVGIGVIQSRDAVGIVDAGEIASHGKIEKNEVVFMEIIAGAPFVVGVVGRALELEIGIQDATLVKIDIHGESVFVPQHRVEVKLSVLQAVCLGGRLGV